MQTFVLASRNRDKIEELRSTLDIFDDIRLKSSLEFPALEEVEEDRDSLEGNALKKAQYTFETTGLPALADDTGLEVDALDGRPGVYSARYASENATYEENMEKLLTELRGVAPKERGAQFKTVVAFVTEDGAYTFEGICRGAILTEQRGEKGFGYDPLFQPEGHEETFAELDPGVKNNISHRGKAIKEFTAWLRADYLS
jgi:XTP/dITP diphosphohydrolase